MANGHTPNKPPLQGDFGRVHTSKPSEGKNTVGPAPKSTIKWGKKTPGVGGSKNS